jgi:hypothetical protein
MQIQGKGGYVTMRDRLLPIKTRLAVRSAARCVPAVALVALLILSAGTARADVFGRLKFSAKNAADEKPIAGAKIVLKDSANVRPDVTLTTDATGTVTSAQL